MKSSWPKPVSTELKFQLGPLALVKITERRYGCGRCSVCSAGLGGGYCAPGSSHIVSMHRLRFIR